MEIRIPQEIVDSTVCPNEYSCISDAKTCGKGSICGVMGTMVYPYSDKTLFIKANPQNSCPYNEPWGFWKTCHCPVRVYLYKEYNI